MSIPAHPDPPIETELLTTPAQVSAIVSQWHDLSVSAARASCFSAPSYFYAWRKAAGDDVRWSVLIARRSGDLVGVMPLMQATVRRGPSCAPRHDFSPSDRVYVKSRAPRPFRMRQISPLVSIPLALIGPAPLCCAGDTASIIKAVVRHLAGLQGWDTFAVPTDVETGQGLWLEALETAGLAPWVLELGREISGIEGITPFDEIVAQQSKNFRKNMRRAKRVADQAGLSIHLWEGADSVRSKLPLIANVAAQSWKHSGSNTGESKGLHIPYQGRQQEFVETLLGIPDLDHDITPILAEARQNGEPVAVSLSLRHGDRLTGLLTFRNELVAGASPGLLLIGRVLDWASERNLAGYDLNLTHNWARYLTNYSYAQNIVICYSNTLRGRVLAAVSRAYRRRRGAGT